MLGLAWTLEYQSSVPALGESVEPGTLLLLRTVSSSVCLCSRGFVVVTAYLFAHLTLVARKRQEGGGRCCRPREFSASCAAVASFSCADVASFSCADVASFSRIGFLLLATDSRLPRASWMAAEARSRLLLSLPLFELKLLVSGVVLLWFSHKRLDSFQHEASMFLSMAFRNV